MATAQRIAEQAWLMRSANVIVKNGDNSYGHDTIRKTLQLSVCLTADQSEIQPHASVTEVKNGCNPT
jgi:hypothetical protein